MLSICKGQNTHYSICIYKNCGINSRKNILNVRFYRLPVEDRERLFTWLVNSGCDDFAEESDAELRKFTICSRHFPPHMIYPSGRLRKNAEPLLYPVDLDDEESINGNVQCHDHYAQIRILEEKVAQQNVEIEKLKKRIHISTLKLRARHSVITRLQKKIITGDLSDKSLLNALFRRVQGFLLTFLLMQLFHKERNSYNDEEKQLAKKMHYTSPSLYRKMREEFGFILPSEATIKTWFNVVNLWPGICNTMFNCLKAKVNCMDTSERNCILLFDEMKIKKGFDFHEKRQKIEGFEDLGLIGHNATVATSALVFMVRGLLHNWKQPIAFYLTGGALNNALLSSALDEVIEAILNTGLKLRAIVCDQGTNNQSVIKHKISIDRPYFMHGQHKIYSIFDIPHIMKSIRNQLLKYNISYDDNKIASWNDVRSLWQLENGKATRAAYKLSEKHVNPNHFDRMKCRLALQVFSRRVSAALLTAGTTGGIDSETVIHTAEFFTILNDSFDSLNSRNCNNPNPNACALSEIRLDVENNLKQLLIDSSKWRTITNKGLKIPPCFEGLQISVRSILQLWDDLKCDGVKFFMTSRVNQDPLENLFSMIRTYGGTYNQNPSAKAFRLLLQKNVVLNLSKPAQSANCLDDEDEILFPSTTTSTTTSVVQTTPDIDELTASINIADFEDDFENYNDQNTFINFEKIVIDASYTNDETLEASAVEYFAGFIAKKCVAKSDCEQCRVSFIDENHELTHARQILTFFRAYETNDGQELGHLCVPTPEFSFVFKIINAVFDAGYPNIRGNYNILDTLFPLMVQAVNMKYPGWFQHETCSIHRKNLAYYMMKIKIQKDLVWLGERLRLSKNRSQHKLPQKLINIQSL